MDDDIKKPTRDVDPLLNVDITDREPVYQEMRDFIQLIDSDLSIPEKLEKLPSTESPFDLNNFYTKVNPKLETRC